MDKKVIPFTGEMVRIIPQDAATLWDITSEQIETDIAALIYPDDETLPECFEDESNKETRKTIDEANDKIINFMVETFSDYGFDIDDSKFVFDLSVIYSILVGVTTEHSGIPHPLYPQFENFKDLTGFKEIEDSVVKSGQEFYFSTEDDDEE
jgi:hypothetical protein